MHVRGIAVDHAVHGRIAVAALALLDSPVLLSLGKVGRLLDLPLLLGLALCFAELAQFQGSKVLAQRFLSGDRGLVADGSYQHVEGVGGIQLRHGLLEAEGQSDGALLGNVVVELEKGRQEAVVVRSQVVRNVLVRHVRVGLLAELAGHGQVLGGLYLFAALVGAERPNGAVHLLLGVHAVVFVDERDAGIGRVGSRIVGRNTGARLALPLQRRPLRIRSAVFALVEDLTDNRLIVVGQALACFSQIVGADVGEEGEDGKGAGALDVLFKKQLLGPGSPVRRGLHRRRLIVRDYNERRRRGDGCWCGNNDRGGGRDWRCKQSCW